jgi:PAT family beta-lactamase induction signal transducer AmpG
MLLLPKFIGGFSGVVVDASSYPVFFLYAASLGIPSVILILILMQQENKKNKMTNSNTKVKAVSS